MDTGEAKIADFEIAILVDKDIAWFEITVDDTGGMDIFQPSLRLVSNVQGNVSGVVVAYQNLIEKVLDELLLERARRKKSMQVGA